MAEFAATAGIHRLLSSGTIIRLGTTFRHYVLVCTIDLWCLMAHSSLTPLALVCGPNDGTEVGTHVVQRSMNFYY